MSCLIFRKAGMDSLLTRITNRHNCWLVQVKGNFIVNIQHKNESVCTTNCFGRKVMKLVTGHLYINFMCRIWESEILLNSSSIHTNF
jgi:hypothetical protein